MKPEGVGAGGNFANGLPGGNIDFGWVDGFIFENMFLDSVESDDVVIVSEVVVEVVATFAKGFDGTVLVNVDDPKENDGI